MISVQEAQTLILQAATVLSTETVELEVALGRVLAEEVLADRDYPPFNRAAMDGYAFRVAEFDPQKAFIMVGTLLAGQTWEAPIPKGHCLKIMTGAPTPPELDALIQVEQAEVLSDGKTVSFPAATPKRWQNIAQKGEDCRENDSLFNQAMVLGPTEIATLAVLGKKTVTVTRAPKVAIFSTGDELIPVGQPVSPFQIRDSNAYALLAFFQQLRIPVARREIVKDQPEALHKALAEVMGYDIVILSGGVSMGDADHVPKVLLELGVQKIFHKVKLKPGKPFWFGKSDKGAAVFALPGNPLSCQVCFKLFIEPYVRQISGLGVRFPPTTPLQSFRAKKVKLDEYFPVRLENGHIVPLSFNGSGDISSTIGSTGIALHPAESGDLEDGTLVKYVAWV